MEETVGKVDRTLVGNIKANSPFEEGLFKIIDNWLADERIGMSWRQVVLAKDRRDMAAHFCKIMIARAIHTWVFKSKELIRRVLVTDHNKAISYIFNDYFRLFTKKAYDPMIEFSDFENGKVSRVEYYKDDIYFDLNWAIEQYCGDQII